MKNNLQNMQSDDVRSTIAADFWFITLPFMLIKNMHTV